MGKIFEYVNEEMKLYAIGFNLVIYTLLLISFMPWMTQQHSSIVETITATNETCFSLSSRSYAQILNVSLDTSLISPGEFRKELLASNSILGNETITDVQILPSCNMQVWNVTVTEPISTYAIVIQKIRGDQNGFAP